MSIRLIVVGLMAAVALTACGGEAEQGDAAVRRAQAAVDSATESLADAEAALSEATTEFCVASADYVTALDRYGDLLTSTAPTVGDVRDAGADLEQPRDDVVNAADTAVAAQEAVVAAEQDLAEAKATLKAAKKGTTPSAVSTPTSSPEPLAPKATINRVKQAESDLEAAQSGIDDQTPLVQASQQFNAAAVALEMAWLQLISDAGCLTDEQQQAAVEAVRSYTMAVQSALASAGYYDGPVDGVYGPETVAAVESLQETHGLPVTGALDKATTAALQGELSAAGGAAAEQELVATTAVQQTLKLTGFWDGPVDGVWTPALTDALKEFQTALGVTPTGTVDAATVSAFEKAIAEAQEPEPTPSESEESPSETESPEESETTE